MPGLFKTMVQGGEGAAILQVCAVRIGVITLKAHGVSLLRRHAWPFSFMLMWLEEQAHCSIKTYYPPQSWIHASFPPTWMKKPISEAFLQSIVAVCI